MLRAQRWGFPWSASPWHCSKRRVSLSPASCSEQLTHDTTALVLCHPPACPATGTHPRAKTSECFEKGSLSSSVSGESWRMISGARWHNQPFWIRSLFSRLPKHGAKALGDTAGDITTMRAASQPSHNLRRTFKPGFPYSILANLSFNPALSNASRVALFLSLPGDRAQFGHRMVVRGSFGSARLVMGTQGLLRPSL